MDRKVKKVGLVIGWIASSIFLGIVLSAWPWPDPGAYVVRWVFPSVMPDAYNAGAVLFVSIGTNILFCLGLLFGVYLVFSRYRLEAWMGTVGVVVGGMALSFLLAMFVVQPGWATPGMYLSKKMFGPAPVVRDRVPAMRAQQCTDAACIFVVLTAVYLAAGRERRKDDRS